jgi:hypothetical protein
MDKFSLNKALNHFNINESDFMEIYNKYQYNQITIEEHYAKEKIMPEIEKWLSEHEDNRIIMELKENAYYSHHGGWCEDCNEINVTISYRKEICYEPNLTYEWGEELVYLEEHQVDFTNVSKLIFEDSRGDIVNELIINN